MPNCGVAELSLNGDGWALQQWPGDPDRAPASGRPDRSRRTSRGSVAAVRGEGSASATVEIARRALRQRSPSTQPWATQAALTGRADVPAADQLGEILDWLEPTSPGSWADLRTRRAGGRPVLPAGLERRPRTRRLGHRPQARATTFPTAWRSARLRTLPSSSRVYGEELTPLVAPQLGRPGRAFLVLRDQGRAVGLRAGHRGRRNCLRLGDHRAAAVPRPRLGAADLGGGDRSRGRASRAWHGCTATMTMSPFYEGSATGA